MTEEHHREFDMENRDRLTRMEAAQDYQGRELMAHIGREEKQEERWLAMFEKLFDQHSELKEELMKTRDHLDRRIDVIREEQAQRKGVEKALLWAGGVMFASGSALLAWVANHWPNK